MRRHPLGKLLFDQLAELGRHEGFSLAGPVASDESPVRYQEVYVHSKIMLVDDAWATVGSANLAGRGFHDDSEMNVSVWHEPTVRALRCELMREHAGIDTEEMDDVAAIDCFRRVARANRERFRQGAALQGLAVEIHPTMYGQEDDDEEPPG